ncbi:hypothetical protein [Bacillus toyonensis]|uniref:hypothetical protein n=1 Tax=Bacillus toyonensis TaxID=155322 RepID=UPI000302160B|nr:hypothetical protein [Bacillus toyonensis]
MEKLNSEKENLILRQQNSEQEITISKEMVSTINESLETMDFKAKQVMINNFIQEIYVDQDNVYINWHF